MSINLSIAEIKLLENILMQAKKSSEKEKPIRKKTDAQIKRDFIKSIK